MTGAAARGEAGPDGADAVDALLSFGVMGAAMQPQGHVQVLTNMVDFGMNPQAAGDAPRVRHEGSTEPTGGAVMRDGGVVHLEPGFAPETIAALARARSRDRDGKRRRLGFRRVSSNPARRRPGRVPRRIGVAQGRARGGLLTEQRRAPAARHCEERVRMDIVLTGIKPTGTLHIGNYVGAIKPAIAASVAPGAQSFFFLADYHAIGRDADAVARSTLEIAASWLALGLDPSKVMFYRQSDIPDILELQWILTSVTAKGLMNRAHAYKAASDANTAAGTDPDQAVMMNLYSYPILMAADILMFKAAKVPVGRDQKQHVEMARDIAQRFNHHYGETFVLPEAVTRDEVALLPGLDGRKMSKSYGNIVPLFEGEKGLRKLIMKIKTNSLEPGQPKDPEDSALYAIYRAFATPEETAAVRERYAAGIGWGEMKQLLFERINSELAPARAEYERLVASPGEVEKLLLAGAERARALSRPFLAEIRERIGIRPLAR